MALLNGFLELKNGAQTKIMIYRLMRECLYTTHH